MKRITLLYALLFMCTVVYSQQYEETKHYDSNPELGGDVLLNKLTKEVKGDNAYSSFEVKVPVSGNYYINFWLCPSKRPDGKYTQYRVLVNNSCVGRITPTRSDWQNISLEDGKTIRLEEGTVTIAVMGNVPEIPNVEFIRLSKDMEKARISDDAYQKYKEEIAEFSRRHVTDNVNDFTMDADTLTRQFSGRSLSFPLGPQTNPPYDADYAIGIEIKYTFYTVVYFSQGQNVSITTSGINNFTHIVELFHTSPTQNNSWAAKSNSSHQASINVMIPQSGQYYVRVRSYNSNSLGMCNLNINNTNLYDSVAVYNYRLHNNKDTQNIYNSFTCYRSGDPRIWVEEGLTPAIITAYNDDYQSTSPDYSWGLNSRVKKQYSTSINSILLSTYGSYNPTCTCDVYCNCLSAYESKGDNFIQSAPASDNYNCASWAGGIYTAWVWPPDVFVNNGLTPLEAFDHFFSITRYYCCSSFTRQGATVSNSVIDLWKINETDTTSIYKHVSVRKGADNNAHGFDWESKLGNYIRVYHPRSLLPLWSNSYISERYRKINRGLFSSLEEAIANGRAVYENVHFTDEEMDYIGQRISNISPCVLSHFHTLYDKWTDAWNSSYYSDPDMIADCDEYRELLAYCRSNESLKYAVFKILDEGNVNAICPLKDLTLKDNRALLDKVFKDNEERTTNEKGAWIFRTMQSNAMLYVKELLMAEAGPFRTRGIVRDESGISYSNSDEFAIRLAGSTILLMFGLDNSSKVWADVIDLQGNAVAQLIRSGQLQAGSYTYQCEVPKGVYLVRYVVDGNVNVKKVIVQ